MWLDKKLKQNAVFGYILFDFYGLFSGIKVKLANNHVKIVHLKVILQHDVKKKYSWIFGDKQHQIKYNTLI